MHKIGMIFSHNNKRKQTLIKQIEEQMQIVVNKKVYKINVKRNYLKNKVLILYSIKTHTI